MSAIATETERVPRACRTARRGRTFHHLLDGGERVVILALYLGLVVRLLASYRAHGDLGSLLLLPSEGVVVVLLLIRRRAAEISDRVGDWLLAAGATGAPLLVAPGAGHALVPLATGAALLLMGLLMQVHAKLVLGRSLGCVAAHRGLKLSGPYRFVRHPMYAGYSLSHLAFLLLNPTPWNLLVYAIGDGLQVPRLLAEERLLSRDPEYRAYQAAVRYRLIPGVF